MLSAILFDSESTLPILKGAKIKEINPAILTMIVVYRRLCVEHRVKGSITGGYDEPCYPVGGIHDRGYALDFNSGVFQEPRGITVEFEKRLREIDDAFRVWYHDTGLGWHFHCEYRP